MSDDFSPFALVADDDAMIRMDASDILETAGFRTHEAAGVEEAMAILEKSGESIQLLFTDVQMPPSKLDGFHLARECARRWPHIRILVASGRIAPGENDMPPNAVFVGKPFSAEMVFQRLAQILPDGMKPAPLLKAVASR